MFKYCVLSLGLIGFVFGGEPVKFEPLCGKVFVTSDPKGAEVWCLEVNKEKALGKTPCIVNLTMGNKFMLLLRLDKFEDAEFEVDIKGTEIIKAETVKMKSKETETVQTLLPKVEKFYDVDVMITDENWKIILDGLLYLDENKKQMSPPVTLKLKNGRHELRLIKFGYQDIFRIIEKPMTINIDSKNLVKHDKLTCDDIYKITRFLDWDGHTWDNDISKSIKIEKNNSVIKITNQVVGGFERKLMLFDIPLDKKVKLIITLLKGNIDFSLRPKDLAPIGNVAPNILDKNKTSVVEFSIVNNEIQLLVDNKKIFIESNPKCYGFFAFLLSKETIFTITQLSF